MDTEQQVARHYGKRSDAGDATLETRIIDALIKSGKDVAKLTAADLSGVDEFHLGWRTQTVELARELGLAPGLRVLDIGSGIGGPARYFAEAHGCRVTGIDLTPEFVACATALTERCGLAGRVDFQQCSALAMPFAASTFDVATLIHVGMNIADKAKLFAEARRVLMAGGTFCVYDVMQMDAVPLPYPMPWAASLETSFVVTPETYRRLLEAAGFRIRQERNRRDFVLDLARKMREDAAVNGAPPLSLHVLMGPAGKERLGNVMAALERGSIAPTEMIAVAI